MELAKSGNAINSESFAIRKAKRSEIEAEWGKADEIKTEKMDDTLFIICLVKSMLDSILKKGLPKIL
jgi:hypothetical protein